MDASLCPEMLKAQCFFSMGMMPSRHLHRCLKSSPRLLQRCQSLFKGPYPEMEKQPHVLWHAPLYGSWLLVLASDVGSSKRAKVRFVEPELKGGEEVARNVKSFQVRLRPQEVRLFNLR